MTRNPSKRSFFQWIAGNGITIAYVVDVGVHKYGTPDLIIAFPKAKHILVEPVRSFQEDIKDIYADIDYCLYQMALGEENGQMILKEASIDRSSRDVTHSHLAAGASILEAEGSSYTVAVKTLASLLNLHPEISSSNSLLKIDVDGHELPILKGGGQMLSNIGLIVIEMPMRFYRERFKFLLDYGFSLIDIVDPTYYCGALSQVDMIFASPSLMQSSTIWQPWGSREFSWGDYEHWGMSS
jgi:FkbM family methyltransferase